MLPPRLTGLVGLAVPQQAVTSVLNVFMHELQLAKFPTNMADCQPKINLPEPTVIPVLLLEKALQNTDASVRLRLLSSINYFKSGENKGKNQAYRSFIGPQLALTPLAGAQQLGVVASITLKSEETTSTDCGPGTPQLVRPLERAKVIYSTTGTRIAA